MARRCNFILQKNNPMVSGVTFAQNEPSKAKQTAQPGKVITKEKKIDEHQPATAGPLKKDGTPDKRYKANQKLKKDGTPDKRYKENKAATPAAK
jgi:hypothetical protein